jgi:hypothetical protein
MIDDLKKNMAGDPQLVRAALNGETSAFGAIVEKYWNMIVALASHRRRLRSKLPQLLSRCLAPLGDFCRFFPAGDNDGHY